MPTRSELFHNLGVKTLCSLEAVSRRATRHSVLTLSLISLTLGCAHGSYEYRKRTDNSGEVPVIRNIEETFPLIAASFVATVKGINIPPAQDTTIGEIDFRKSNDRLYEVLDQLNGHVRTMVVGGYQSFITSQLDTDPAARKLGHARWERVMAEINQSALKVRDAKNKYERRGEKLAQSPQDKAVVHENKKQAEEKKKQAEKDMKGAEYVMEHLRMARELNKKQYEEQGKQGMPRPHEPAGVFPGTREDLEAREAAASQDFRNAIERRDEAIKTLTELDQATPGSATKALVSDLEEVLAGLK